MMKRMRRRPSLFWIPLLVAVVFAAYANSFENTFLYDDEFLIQKNAFLRAWTSILTIFTTSSTGGSGALDSFYRPMQQVAYLLTFQIFGEEPFGFHLLNTLLHAGNAVLVYVLARRLDRGPLVAGLAALLWSVHPLHTEAVTYMSATADPLHAMFVLLGLALWVPTFSAGATLLAAVCFVGGLLSKESAIVFPALALVVLLAFHPEGRRPRTWLKTAPFWLIAFAYLIARQTILNFNGAFQFYKHSNIYSENLHYRFFTFLATLPAYIEQLAWPHDLHMDRAFPVFTSFASGPVLLGFAILLGVFAQWFFAWRANRWTLAWGTLWFFAAHAPQSGVLLPVNSMFLEHWMYLPTTGLFIALFDRKFEFWKTAPMRALIVAGTSALAVWWMVVIHERNETWHDPISFYEDLLSHNPDVARVHNNLAMAYAERNDDANAEKHYLEAIRLADSYAETRHNLGRLYLAEGKTALAIEQFETAIRMRPDFYHSYGALAEAYKILGDEARSREAARKFEETRAKFIH